MEINPQREDTTKFNKVEEGKTTRREILEWHAVSNFVP